MGKSLPWEAEQVSDTALGSAAIQRRRVRWNPVHPVHTALAPVNTNLYQTIDLQHARRVAGL
jgi:hypothetical protein